jgi:hypothetical protein
LPVEAVIDRKVLALFTSICRLHGSQERSILQRQLAMKDLSSHSYVVRARIILRKYHLPSAYKLFCDPPSKLCWKRLVKRAIADYWTAELKEDASRKVSLFHIGYSTCRIGNFHPVWDTTCYSFTDIQRACVKVKILTQQISGWTINRKLEQSVVANQFPINRAPFSMIDFS